MKRGLSLAAPTALRRAASGCRCDGDGWFATLDRGRYVPGVEDAVVVSHCPCGRRTGGAVLRAADHAPAEAAIEARDVTRRFRATLALEDVSFAVSRGAVHALLGPNGAGKTTLIRILAGLLVPDAGAVRIMGIDATGAPRAARRLVGLVPSGDRSFYLRISGLENLVFFGRMHGLSRKHALARAHDLLDQVGLLDAARRSVGLYSHGMQKRLAVARALLPDPLVLLVDEATHDLDPQGARRIRELVAAATERGTAVLWTTQRIDEIRSFAHRVTVLGGGRVRFAGTVPELMARAAPRRHLLRLSNCRPAGEELLGAGQSALGGQATLARDPGGGRDHYLLALEEGVVLGDALAALAAARIQVLGCQEEQSQLEEAFVSLTREGSR